jgi:hypothetical protein
MTIQSLEKGIMAFAETYVAPNFQDSMDRWMFYFGLGSKGLKLEAMLAGYAPIMQALGIMMDNGEISLDELESRGRAAFAKQPRIKIWKLTFTEADFAALMQHLRNPA